MKKQLEIRLRRIVPRHRAIMLDCPESSFVQVSFAAVDEDTPDGLLRILVQAADNTCGGGHNEIVDDLPYVNVSWDALRFRIPSPPTLGEGDDAGEVAARYAADLAAEWEAGHARYLAVLAAIPALPVAAITTGHAARTPELSHTDIPGVGRLARIDLEYISRHANARRGEVDAYRKQCAAEDAERQAREASERQAAREAYEAARAEAKEAWRLLAEHAAHEAGQGERYDRGFVSDEEQRDLVRELIWPPELHPDCGLFDKRPRLSDNDVAAFCDDDCYGREAGFEYEIDETTSLNPPEFEALQCLEKIVENAPAYEGEWTVTPMQVTGSCCHCDATATLKFLRVEWSLSAGAYTHVTLSREYAAEIITPGE